MSDFVAASEADKERINALFDALHQKKIPEAQVFRDAFVARGLGNESVMQAAFCRFLCDVCTCPPPVLDYAKQLLTDDLAH